MYNTHFLSSQHIVIILFLSTMDGFKKSILAEEFSNLHLHHEDKTTMVQYKWWQWTIPCNKMTIKLITLVPLVANDSTIKIELAATSN